MRGVAAHTLRRLHAHTQRFLLVRQRRSVFHSKQNDRRIFLFVVDFVRLRLDTRGRQKAEAGNSPNFLPMMVVDLNERLLVADREDLADVLVFLHETPEQPLSRLRFRTTLVCFKLLKELCHSTITGFVKALATGERYDVGENEKLQM